MALTGHPTPSECYQFVVQNYPLGFCFVRSSALFSSDTFT